MTHGADLFHRSVTRMNRGASGDLDLPEVLAPFELVIQVLLLQLF